MGVLGAIFTRSHGRKSAERAVKAIEHIRGPNGGMTKVDSKKLPMERAALKLLLRNEIDRLRAAPGGLPTARRYAECYIAIAFFQPGVDAAGEAYRRVFAAPRVDIDRLLRVDDGIDVWSERDSYVAELYAAGHGDLVPPDIFDPTFN